FITGNRPQMAEWVFDPRRRHASPADDNAARLCLSGSDLPAGRLGTPEPATATVTPIGSRFAAHPGESRRDESRPGARAVPAAGGPATAPPAPVPPGVGAVLGRDHAGHVPPAGLSDGRVCAPGPRLTAGRLGSPVGTVG